jgi:hypothetical protein
MQIFKHAVKVNTTVAANDSLNRLLSSETDCTQGDPHKL